MAIQNKRILKILNACRQSRQPLTGRYLADLIGVSSRTIRSDIKEANDFLRGYGAHIRAEAGSGYSLVIDDETAYAGLTGAYAPASVVPSDHGDRAAFIIARILLNALHDKIVRQETLADELFISLSTLKKYLGDIKKSLARFNLELASDRRRGIRIRGGEVNIRRAISEYVFNHDDLVDLARSPLVGELFPAEEMAAVQRILLTGILKHDIRLTDVAFKNLLVHIVITLRRVGAENSVEYTEDERKKLRQSHYFAAAQDILDMTRREVGVDLANEVYYLTQHFIASQKFIEFGQNRDQPAPLVKEILLKIETHIGICLFNDAELISGLSIHLIAALHRLRFKMNIRNETLAIVKKQYPLAFEMAILAGEVMELSENVKTNENEIGYLAIHFGAALERRRLRSETGKTALIVCGAGLSTALLLKSRLQRRFGGLLKIQGVMGCYELTDEIAQSVDFIFATVPIPHIASDRVILVEPIMTEDDFARVKRQISRHTFGAEETDSASLFKRELFFTGIAGGSAREIIEILCGAMIETGYIDETIRRSVLEREAMASTELGGLVAIPHALENGSADAAIAVGILKEPIRWKNEFVQVVFLLSIPKHLCRAWESMFKQIYRAFIGGCGAQKLLQNSKFDVLIDLLEHPAQRR